MLFKALIAATAATASPVTKVVELLDNLHAKVTAAGEQEQAAFEKFFGWCHDFSIEKKHEIEVGSSSVESHQAAIGKASADGAAAAAKIEEFAAQVLDAEQQLAAAKEVRASEHNDFTAAQAELQETVDTLRRAQSVLSRALSNPGAKALLQKSESLVDALGALVDASGALTSSDRQTLTQLVQGVSQPEARAYEAHSGGILDVLADLHDKAEEELAQAQKSEMQQQHTFELKAQGLNNVLKNANAGLTEERAAREAAAEGKAVAEGDLQRDVAELKNDKGALKDAQHDCMDKAASAEESRASRAAELAAIEQATAIIKEKTGGAAEHQYSFVQLSSSRSQSDAARFVERLARQQNDSALVQFASQLRNPFANVKNLISSMIYKLENQAQADASEHAFCTEEAAKSTASRDKKQSTVDKLTAKIDGASAKAAKLSSEAAALTQELHSLAKLQREADATRQAEAKAYAEESTDLKNGIEGVSSALKILREYYNTSAGEALLQAAPAVSVHAASGDAATGIIGMLEVIESDFTKSLAEAEADEREAKNLYEKNTSEYKVTVAQKQKDVEYKSAEAASLQKKASELSSDRESTQAELESVLEYLTTLRVRCVKKPETYAERKARREAEINGLKSALNILENQASGFLQIRQH